MKSQDDAREQRGKSKKDEEKGGTGENRKALRRMARSTVRMREIERNKEKERKRGKNRERERNRGREKTEATTPAE